MNAIDMCENRVDLSSYLNVQAVSSHDPHLLHSSLMLLSNFGILT